VAGELPKNNNLFIIEFNSFQLLPMVLSRTYLLGLHIIAFSAMWLWHLM
jgi:hypothetical protein